MWYWHDRWIVTWESRMLNTEVIQHFWNAELYPKLFVRDFRKNIKCWITIKVKDEKYGFFALEGIQSWSSFFKILLKKISRETLSVELLLKSRLKKKKFLCLSKKSYWRYWKVQIIYPKFLHDFRKHTKHLNHCWNQG